jgi:hypothetical protein
MDGRWLDNMNKWRWVASSRIGTSHQRLGTRKQDAFKCFLAPSKSPIVCAIVADGAGSAEFGGQGASIVCRILSIALKAHFKITEDLPSEDDIRVWLDNVRDCLGNAAKNKKVRRQNFASTLVMLVASHDRSIVAHIGDGAVVARDKEGNWTTLSCPENGEYASTTYFVTDDPTPSLRVNIFDAHDGYALFSDGLEDVGLDQSELTPYQPFFNTMLRPLEQSSILGHDQSLSSALGTFLDSERVCARTDDDKTLILLSSL